MQIPHHSAVEGPTPDSPVRRRDRVHRIVYSSVGLALIGGAVAILGAPVKW